MADEEAYESYTYTINCWDCPVCSYVHYTDADLDEIETCDSCGAEVKIR